VLIAEVCERVDRWRALEAELFTRAGAAVASAGGAGAKTVLAEVSRHAGARALRWDELRPAAPIAVTATEVPSGSPAELLDLLVAEYGAAMRTAEPASDAPVLAVLRVASLEAAGDRRRLDG